MKIKVEDERYFPTLGILAQPGDEVDVPDSAFDREAPVVAAPSNVKSTSAKAAQNETVVNDGSAAQ